MQRIAGPLLDVGLALLGAVATLIAIGVAPQPGRRSDALAYLLGLTIAGLVLARRRWPVAVLVASAAALRLNYLLDYAGIRSEQCLCEFAFPLMEGCRRSRVHRRESISLRPRACTT